ncbi:MAG: glycosyltransferase family 2 protein [Bdellovibrionales bacterium]|nr:glycosyltransferase family 2 protein [Bdellovibrionales bacterium]
MNEASTIEQRKPISAFIICCNEENYIADCVKSVAFCDEVLVVDSFSSDRTVEIAKELGAKVIQREWPGYKKQKSYALSQTSHEWVLNLDADERVSETLKNNILEVLRRESMNGSSSSVIGYDVNRLVYYLGRWWRKGGWYPEYRLRFFRKSQVTWGGIDPHEKPIPHGPTGRLDGDIYHFTYKDMNDQADRLNKFSTLAAKERFAIGEQPSLIKMLVNPWVRFVKFYFLKRGFQEGMAGFIIAVLEGYYTFMKYAKLWEFHYNAKKAADEGKS